MNRLRIAGGCAIALVLLGVLACMNGRAQAESAGEIIHEKLVQAGLIDPYFPEVALEVGEALRQADADRWAGVQVDGSYREGFVNIYMVDADKLPNENLLEADGVNFTADSLQGGAMADPATGVVFINSNFWRRLTAATYLKQSKAQPSITAALAQVDAVGLDAARPAWDPATLTVDTPETRRTGWLMRGAFAFVLAHEMGHLSIGQEDSSAVGADAAVIPKELTERQKDERRACPETLNPRFRQQQSNESAADMAAVALLGQQCRIGADGNLRYRIYLLGTQWFFTAAMGDKLLQMGRASSSPVIAQALRSELGPALYEQVVAARADKKRKGAVKVAFPPTHPPDASRMRAIETALAATPCGSAGIDTSGAQLIEQLRANMCRGLISQPEQK
jgi:hypothetical protein